MKIISLILIAATVIIAGNTPRISFATEMQPYPPGLFFYEKRGARGNWIQVTGEVERFFGNEITLNTGADSLIVNVDELDISRMDNIIQVGDRITVVGEFDASALRPEVNAWRIHFSSSYGEMVLGR